MLPLLWVAEGATASGAGSTEGVVVEAIVFLHAGSFVDTVENVGTFLGAGGGTGVGNCD